MIIVSSCSKDHSAERLEELKLKYNGKYQIFSSYSNKTVDLNWDGEMSGNLLEENPELKGAEIDILICKNEPHLITDMWPRAYPVFPEGEVFDRSIHILNYLQYILTYKCYLTSDYSLVVDNSVEKDSDNPLISIDKVTFENDEVVKVIATRKIFTSNGWTIITNESKYKRYTYDF